LETDFPKILVDYAVTSRYYEDFGDSELQKPNSMLLKSNDPEPGVWTRSGLATIDERDWLKVERNWKMVVLE
jgi:hypothetical protein